MGDVKVAKKSLSSLKDRIAANLKVVDDNLADIDSLAKGHGISLKKRVEHRNTAKAYKYLYGKPCSCRPTDSHCEKNGCQGRGGRRLLNGRDPSALLRALKLLEDIEMTKDA